MGLDYTIYRALFVTDDVGYTHTLVTAVLYYHQYVYPATHRSYTHLSSQQRACSTTSSQRATGPPCRCPQGKSEGQMTRGGGLERPGLW